MAWRKTVNIKHHLTASGQPEACLTAAHGIARSLRLGLRDECENDFDLQDIVEELEAMEDPSADDLNSVLCLLYDWADANRVWLGLRR